MRLGDEPAEAGAEVEAHDLELGRDRPGGGPHVGVAALVVVEREVGDVGAHEGPGPPDDRVEDDRGVAHRGQLAGGVDERGELLLATALHVEGAADAHGEVPSVRVDVEGGEVGGRRAGGEQLEQAGAHVHVIVHAADPRRRARATHGSGRHETGQTMVPGAM